MLCVMRNSVKYFKYVNNFGFYLHFLLHTMKTIFRQTVAVKRVSQPETQPSDIQDEEDEDEEETEDEASIGVPWNRSEM